MSENIWEKFKQSLKGPSPEEEKEKEKDQQLWEAFKKGKAPRTPSKAARAPSHDKASHAKPTKMPRQAFLTKFTRKKERALQKGLVRIDAQFDLHGLTEHEAHDRALAFIQSHYEAEKRTLLIITGKGRESGGILRQNFPRWLNEKNFRRYVMRYEIAHPAHGGDGAFYIFLRKKRLTIK